MANNYVQHALYCDALYVITKYFHSHRLRINVEGKDVNFLSDLPFYLLVKFDFYSIEYVKDRFGLSRKHAFLHIRQDLYQKKEESIYQLKEKEHITPKIKLSLDSFFLGENLSKDLVLKKMMQALKENEVTATVLQDVEESMVELTISEQLNLCFDLWFLLSYYKPFLQKKLMYKK
ncbi:hypothetical protein [Listeria seeligeri]|uniref:hypothetical protein n=1 Tax=Listeria seeligeri TaxID=1640 RepID=UPI0022EBF514|nr:hypothetical protein [Listeria seeligeri]